MCYSGLLLFSGGDKKLKCILISRVQNGYYHQLVQFTELKQPEEVQFPWELHLF